MMIHKTYADKEGGHSGQYGKCKCNRDDLGRVLGIGSEDVMDLSKLAISQRLLVTRRRRGRVQLDGEIENRGD